MSLFGIKSTISIDFGDREIRVVEGKYSKKGVVINKSFSIPIDEGLYVDGEIQDMDQLAYLLRDGLAENKISQGDANGVINSTKIIMREISMPKVDKGQIEAILRYQLSDYLPINPEEYVVKHIGLGSIMEDGVEKLNLLLIGVPRNIVEGHLNLFKNVGLRPNVLDYAGNSIIKLINAGESINDFYDNQNSIACIDLSYGGTGLTINHQGTMKVSRVIDIDSKAVLEDLAKVEALQLGDISDELNSNSQEYSLVQQLRGDISEILQKIEMVIRYYKTREVGNDIDLILLYSDMSNIDGIEKIFSDFFDKPCVKLKSLSKVKYNDDLSKYANAIGGLIRLGEV